MIQKYPPSIPGHPDSPRAMQVPDQNPFAFVGSVRDNRMVMLQTRASLAEDMTGCAADVFNFQPRPDEFLALTRNLELVRFGGDGPDLHGLSKIQTGTPFGYLNGVFQTVCQDDKETGNCFFGFCEGAVGH
jgi:hypothetical protein